MSSRNQRVVAETPQRSATSASNATQFGLRATSKISIDREITVWTPAPCGSSILA